MAIQCRKYRNDLATGRFGVKQPLSLTAGISSVTATGLTSFAYRNTTPYYYKGMRTTPIPVSDVIFTIVYAGVFAPTTTSFWLSETEANAGSAPGVNCQPISFSVNGDLAIADWTISSPDNETKPLYVVNFKTQFYQYDELKIGLGEAAKSLVCSGPELDKFQATLGNAGWINKPTLEQGATFSGASVLKLPPGARATFRVQYPWSPKKRLVVATSGKVSATLEAKVVVFDFSVVARAVDLVQQ